MRDRFTPVMLAVVSEHAPQEARLMGHRYLLPEHILLGLIAEGEGVAADALRRLGVSLENARPLAREACGWTSSPIDGPTVMTDKVRRLSELALREALSIGHSYIGTEHFLLALVRRDQADSGPVQVLAAMGISRDQVRQMVIQILSGYFGPPERNRPEISEQPQQEVRQLSLVERIIAAAPAAAALSRVTWSKHGTASNGE